MNKLKLISSSSFRLALSTFAMVSVASACFLLIMYFFIKDALISDVIKDLDEASEALILDVEQGRFFHPDLYPFFANVEVYDGDWESESLDNFIVDYQDFLQDVLVNQDLPKAERLAVLARLFVMEASQALDQNQVPFEIVEHLLNEEVPEEFHDWLDDILAKHKPVWPNFPKPYFSISDSVFLYLDQDGVLNSHTECIELIHSNRKVLHSNLIGFQQASFLLPEEFELWVQPQRLNKAARIQQKGPTVCIVKILELMDGGTLILGESIDQSYPLINKLGKFLLLGLVSIFLLAILCGYWVAITAVKRISDVNGVCERVAQGELSLRVPEYGSGDDYDQLAHYINAMLNRMLILLDGVKRVSDNIAHDLKTPLSRMQTQLNQLLDSPAPSKQAIHAILNENQRIIHCFNALLRIAEIEQGAQRKAFSLFLFSDVINTLVDVYEPAIEQKKINLDVKITAVNSRVYGDQHQWSQALANMLDNAIKYSPAGGHIQLQLKQSNHELEIILIDSGPGIPLDKQVQVFERFYRLDNHRGEPGFGLGLSLVNAVCQLHGARIHLENCNGLQIRISIPLK